MSIAKKIIIGLLTFLLSLMLMVNLVMVVTLAMVKSTVLNSAFLEKELDSINAASLVKDKMAEEKDEFIGDLGPEGERLYGVMEGSLSEELLRGQVHTALNSVFSYLNSKTDTLEFTVSAAGLKENMKRELRKSVLQSRPQGLQDLSETELDKYLQAAYEGIDDLPAELGIRIENLDKLEPLRDAMKAFNPIFFILWLTAIVLALLLVLLHFSVKGVCRVLGIPLLIVGILFLAAAMAGANIASSQISQMDLPSPLTPETVTTVARDFLGTVTPYGIAFGVIGLALLGFSFFWRERAKLDKVTTESGE